MSLIRVIASFALFIYISYEKLKQYLNLVVIKQELQKKVEAFRELPFKLLSYGHTNKIWTQKNCAPIKYILYYLILSVLFYSNWFASFAYAVFIKRFNSKIIGLTFT